MTERLRILKWSWQKEGCNANYTTTGCKDHLYTSSCVTHYSLTKNESFFPQVPCKGYSTKEEIIVLRYQASVSKQIAPKIAQESKQGYMIYSKMRV